MWIFLVGPKMEFLPPARPHGDRDSDLVGSRWEQGRSRLPRARPREHVAEIPRRSLHREVVPFRVTPHSCRSEVRSSELENGLSSKPV